MLRAAARRFVGKSAVAALRRLPESVQLRLWRELATLLGDQAGKASPVLGLREAPGLAQPIRDPAANLKDSRLDVCARILTAPVSERVALLRELMALIDVKPAEFVAALPQRLGRAENASLFQQFAHVLQVSAAEVSGANGRLTGYLGDEGIFLPYLRESAWFWNAVEFINSIFLGRRQGTFIDIGANIGAVVVPIARANPAVRCFAFEPEPNNFLALAQNIARNRVSENVKAFETALAEADGAATFELSGSNFGDHRLRRPGHGGAAVFDEDDRSTTEVKARRLDGILKPAALARPIVIKIDVQGAEPMVLAGGESVVSEAETVIVEYWPYGMRRLGRDPMEFLDAFSAMFPFVAPVGDQPIAWSHFTPFAATRGELETFAEKRTWMHLNLAFAKRRTPAGRGS